MRIASFAHILFSIPAKNVWLLPLPSMCLVRVPTPQVVDQDVQLAHSQFTVLHLQFVVCCSVSGG